MTQETLPICLNDPDKRGFFEEIQVGRFAKISFMRTLRVPDDGKSYPLPMGLGRFPIHRVADYAEKVPNSWLKEGGFFIPMYQGEAMYMNFEGVDWHPNIAKICVGRINAITAEKYSNELSSIKQDYVVIPDQRWLDGVATGKDKVRQFVAMPLGKGYTIEAQITDEEIYGGFQITVFDAKDDKFPDRDIESEVNLLGRRKVAVLYQDGEIMGIAPGGIIDLQIFQDPYGMHTWDSQKNATFTVHLVNSHIYKSITGFDPPQKSIDADTYQRLGYPWFHYYDETSPTVEPPSAFKRLLSVAAIECKRFLHVKEQKIVIDEKLIKKIKTPTKEEAIKNHREKAINHFENNDWKVAKKEITFVIDFFTDVSEQDYLVRSLCNFELKNYKEADIDAQYALELNPHNTEIIKIRSKCLLEQKKYHDLIEFAEGVIECVQFEINKNKSLQFDKENLKKSLQLGLEIKNIGLKLMGKLSTDNVNSSKLKIEKLLPEKHECIGEIVEKKNIDLLSSVSNPAELTLKWAFFNEEVAVEGGRKSLLPSGSFQFQEKLQDDTWVKHKITQKEFALAIIDHSFVQIEGADFDGQRMVRSYWSNEMRMSDVMTTPFILNIEGVEKDAKSKTYAGSYQDLKDKFDIKGRMHVVYGVTTQGMLVKLVLPYYSYSLGTEKFSTHGDTFLDADKKSDKGGLANCFLAYDGFHVLKNGSTTYTVPKFRFEKTINDGMIVIAAKKMAELDAWYEIYHKSNLNELIQIDKVMP
jgi:hypothetical protein